MMGSVSLRLACLPLALVLFARVLIGAVPDLTKTIDFERSEVFHLGPTGAKGWIYAADNFMTTEARQILVTEVEPGSVSEGVLEVGDVILGIGEDLFSSDARMALGWAIDEAESTEDKGILKLIRWRPLKDAEPRKGTLETVELKLRVMGSYSDTAPWKCPKTKLILKDALKVIVESKDMGRLGATALALLATGEKEHLALVREYLHNQKWASPELKISVEIGGKQSWSSGFHNLLLTEYFLASGDEYVLPAIREYAIKTAMGQSGGGTWGHGFAWTSQNGGKLHGGLPGYGALNQAGLPCYLSLLLSRKCGVDHPEVDDAISRSSRFFQQFIDKGSIGYGYHRPSLEIHANGRNGMSGNGKNGLAAIAFRVEGNRPASRFFSKLTASLYSTCEYGHSGNSYSYFWDPLGANCGGPKLVSAFLKELRWYYALTRKADGSFVNQQLGGVYGGKLLSPTAAQVLIATLPRRAIYLTGKGQEKKERLKKKEVAETMDSGRWRLAETADMTAEDLLAELDSWSPIAREWVAIKLAKKEGDLVPRLLRMLESKSPEARAGACAALGYLGERAAPAVPRLAKALTDEESIVGMSAAYALARIGKPSQQAIPNLLQAVLDTKEPEQMKPRQQALAYSFGYASGRYAPLYFDGILPQAAKDGNPLDEVDRKLLYAAVTQMLNDSSGRTRGSAAYALKFFNRRDVAAMAQQIHDAIKTVAMNYRMMDDGPRFRGLELMARFNIKEGIPLCFETFDFKRWGSVMRVPARFEVLQSYAGNAKPFLPQLREMRTRWKQGEHRDMLEKTIRIIEQDAAPPPMISLHDLIDERLASDLSAAKDDQQRLALCRKFMTQWPGDYFYQAACLRQIVSIQGAKALNDLMPALASPNEILHESAVSLAAELPGVGADHWVGQLTQAKGRGLAGVLDVLARRKDPKALQAARTFLEHEDPLVREAATRAVGAIDEAP
jgi:HEAT repeat protein